ncbi:MAG: NAD(P)/FAD-dependent oxidoreductase [Candidatus Latescibacterota bacterium]
MNNHYRYIIVGGGLAGASAIEGIREIDSKSPILLIGAETYLPYDRPPLTKKLWFGQKKVGDIFLHEPGYYERNEVSLKSGVKAISIEAAQKTVWDDKENVYRFDKLLLATGGFPSTLPITGGDTPGIYYYRTLDDYCGLRYEAAEGKTATVIGGGFIGSEITAALTISKVQTTMIFPEPYLCFRVFPRDLGGTVQQRFREKGVEVLHGEKPAKISRERGKFMIRTEKDNQVISDILVVGIGIRPSVGLAGDAGLEVGNGIVVNQYLQTSHQDIYAAGDNALFPYQALGRQMRIEHWDNARAQGKAAGRNMAGAAESFTYMPYFFSDLFEFGYEAVGDVNSELETHADWQKEYDTGTVYYVMNNKIRGAMMCNVWEKVDEARALIEQGESVPETALHGAFF